MDAEGEGYDPNEKPSLYELQIPDSPGPVVKPKKFLIKPKPKDEQVPKKIGKDFSVQANGLNNQSNQTEVFEDESLKHEIRELRNKIDALKNPSRIPRKNGTSNLFNGRFSSNHGKMRHSTENVGIQSLSTSTSSIQTNDYTDSSTETSKLFVNSATDPMSLKRKQSKFMQPEFVSAATSPNFGSNISLQTNSPGSIVSGSEPSLRSISPDSSYANANSEPNSRATSELKENVSDMNLSIKSSSPPPVIVSSPTPPLTENKNSQKKENVFSLSPTTVPKTTPSITENQFLTEKDSNDSFTESANEDEDHEKEDDDKLENVTVSQSKVFKSSIPKLKGSFKLCVDSVRMLPDNAITFKISGKLLNLPEKSESSFSVYPELEWPHKSPRCIFEKVYNKDEKELKKNLGLFIKIYTIDRISEKVAYVGYSLLNLVDEKSGLLKGGGHKLNVYSGAPKPSNGKVTNLSEKDINSKKRVPCLTICIRIVESSTKFKPRPVHKEGYYDAKISSSKIETKLYAHYFSLGDYNITLQKFCDDQKWIDQNHKTWVKKLYEDPAKPSTFSFRYFNKKDIKQGVKIKILSAAGLPFNFEETYFQCVVEVVGHPGKQITKALSMTSFQKFPKWTDDAFLFKPGHTKKNSAILIKIYGVYCQNILEMDKKSFQVSLVKNKQLKLLADKPIAWTVCPLFAKDCVEAGIHIVPLFSGSPPDSFIKLMESRGPTGVLIKFALSKSIMKTFKTPAVLKLQVYDALYSESELLEEMIEMDERLLESAGIADKYHDLVEGGPKVSQILGQAFQDQNLPTPTNSQLTKAFDSLVKLMSKEFGKLVKT